HGDWFGLGRVRERYPNVRAVATARVVEDMRGQVLPKTFAPRWESRFPGQIQREVRVGQPLSDLRLDLEGNWSPSRLVTLIRTTQPSCTFHHSDGSSPVMRRTTTSICTFAESGHDERMEWIRALDVIDALHPRAVVAGHKRAGRADDPTIIDET